MFHFDPVEGYCGKLLSTDRTQLKNDLAYGVPDDLNQELLFCILNGSKFATAVWPHIFNVRVHNFFSTIVDARIIALVPGLHIGPSEHCVSEICLYSPLFASIFGKKGYSEKFDPSARKITIETISNDELNFETTIGLGHLGISHTYGPSVTGLSPSVEATGYLRIEFKEQALLVDAIKMANKIEQLLSLLCFSYVKSKAFEVEIEITSGEGKGKHVSEKVDRGILLKEAKTDISWHELPIHLQSGHLFGTILDGFLQIYEKIEQTLNWYRIVIAEDRYLEDKYFYSVRMIDALYQRLGIEVEGDKSAVQPLKDLASVVNDANRADLAEFITKRVAPVFKRSSLADKLRDLKRRYQSVIVTKLIDERMVAELRGKEAHGSTERFAKQEYQFMAFAYNILTKLYTLLILERCGLEREFLLSSLAPPHIHNRMFSSQWFRLLGKRDDQND